MNEKQVWRRAYEHLLDAGLPEEEARQGANDAVADYADYKYQEMKDRKMEERR